MKRWWWLLPTLVLAAVVALAQEPAPAPAPPVAARETDARAALDAFWGFFLRGDAAGVRLTVDLPLTLLQPGAEDEAPSRIIVTSSSWASFRSGFPATPLRAEEVDYQLDGLRLEWLDAQTCVALYELQVTIQGDETGGRMMSVLNDHDGWKVVVSSLPL